MAAREIRHPARPTTGPAHAIPEEVRQLVELLDGEEVVRTWRTRHGYLVATNLRCLEFWRGDGVFTPTGWHSSAQYYFFSLAPPTVVHHRYVQLQEDSYERQGARYEVSDPTEAAAALEHLRQEGKAEWEHRRALAANHPSVQLGRTPDRPPVIVREVVREIVKMPCRYCGRLMLASASACPTCGAPART